MRKYNDILKKYSLKPLRYKLKGKATLIDTDSGSFVIKERTRNDTQKIYHYLSSRSFNYYPAIIGNGYDNYEVSKYIDGVDMSNEQKIFDLIDLVSLLHNKTTHYKEVDEADYKKIYEDITGNIDYLHSYYNDIASIIESRVYMSPSEYLFIRNISKIYSALNFCKNELERWYELIKDKRKQRHVVLHNNLRVEHYIRSDLPYLVSWDKSKIDLPIFDIYKLYRNHGLDFDFSELLKRYESNYKLLEEERMLFFILIALPDKIDFSGDEYELCQGIGKKIDLIYKTEIFLSPYYSNNTVK